MVELSVGAHKAESRSDKGLLRSDIVQSRVGDHPRESVVGGYGEKRNHRLRGVTMAPGGRSQAVADLDAATIGLALEAEPPDGPAVAHAGDPVVAERTLLSVCGGGAKEPPDGADVALEGEIIGPRIGWSRTPIDDTFRLCHVDCMQLKTRCSNVGHGGRESATAEQPGYGHD